MIFLSGCWFLDAGYQMLDPRSWTVLCRHFGWNLNHAVDLIVFLFIAQRKGMGTQQPISQASSI